MMKRTLSPLLAVVAFLLLSQAASARVIELGANGTPANPRPSCPEQCEVLYRTTAYPGRIGGGRKPYVFPRDGYVLAFTVPLGRPNAEQIRFFEEPPPEGNFGFGRPSVRLALLRKSSRRRTSRDHRLMAQSPLFQVGDYLGSAPTFVLREPIRVRRGWIAAITTPSWLPAFATGLARSNWWRSSRRRGRCGSRSALAPPSAQQRLRSVATWGCGYFTTRPVYTVTYVPDNRRTRSTR
jgi:hypothetical protein